MDDDQTEKPNPKKAKQSRRRRRWIVLSIFVVLAVTFGLIWQNLNAPVEGTITPPKVPNVPAPVQLQTPYFTTTYPARYKMQKVPSGQSASLGAWVLEARQAPGAGQSSRINLTVSTLPTGGVTEDSAYKLFTAQSQYYTLSQSKLGDDPVTIAIRNDPTYQKTILWPHGNYLLTVSLLTANEQDQANSDLQIVLTNLRWLK